MKNLQNKIPELRFPEFDGEWERKRLGDVGKITSGGTPSRYKKEYWNGNIPWISTTLINFNTINNTEEFITNKGLASSSAKLFPKETLLMAMYGQGKTRGKVAILGIEASTNQACCAIITNGNLNTDYLFQNLVRKYNEIRKLSNDGGQKNLSSGLIKNIQISFPSLLEQTRIANFLTVVDKKISQLKQKKALLEEYKKGVMQKIFSQEIRFKDENGNYFPAWEEKRLREVCDNVMYGMNAQALAFDGENKYIRITDINENSRKYIPNPLTSPDGLLEEKYKLKKGDVVFARTGASVGKSYLYSIDDGKLYFAGFLIRFSIIEGNPFFIYAQTLISSYQKWVKIMSMRSGQPGINAEEYKTLKIVFPTLPEQTKIANFLTKLDEKINRVDSQIKKAELWKKGLLQRMFCLS